jgi:hypothetical protein
MGRMLITAGIVLVVVGLLTSVLGRLPGDIYYRGKNSTFYFPIVTCILVSLVLSLVLWIVRRL